MKLERKLKGITQKIAKKYGIEYAFLFGSYTGKYQLEDSDVDVAIKLKDKPKNFKEKLSIIAQICSEIENEIGKEVDLIIMNDTDLGLKFEIFRTGKVLFYEEYNELVENKSRTIAEYQDFYFWSKELFNKMIKGIVHGRK